MEAPDEPYSEVCKKKGTVNWVQHPWMSDEDDAVVGDKYYWTGKVVHY